MFMYKALLTALFICSAAIGIAQTSRITASKTTFSIKYWAGTCEGTFDGPKGTVKFNPANLDSSMIDVSVSANSFNTGNGKRDKDVKGAKYLHASAHPAISFKSSKITGKDGSYTATGTMGIKGVSRQMSIPFKAAKKPDGSYAITSSFSLNRLDYKVGEDTRTMKDIVSINVSATIK